MKYINSFVLLIISGSAFTPSFKGPGHDWSSKKLKGDPDRMVILAITNATLDKSKRKKFDNYSKEIYSNLKENSGYLGGTVNVQFFGDEVWTMTVWENKDSLKKFVDGRRHLDAMYMSNAAMTKFRSMHIEIKANKLPITWDEAKKIINTYPYDEHKPY